MQRNHGIKKLREIKLSQNSNDIDMGAPNSEKKLGNKSEEQLRLENERLTAELQAIKERDIRTKRLEHEDYLKRLQLGDPEAQQVHMKQMQQIRQYNEQITIQSRYERLEKQRLANIEKEKKEIEAKVAKLTPEQRQRRLDAENRLIERHKNELLELEDSKKEAIDIVDTFFQLTPEEFKAYYKEEEHSIETSPVGLLIKNTGNGYECMIDRNERVIRIQPDVNPHSFSIGANVVQQVEDHIYNHRPEIHKEYVLKKVNKIFLDKLNEAKERHTKEARDQYLRI